MHWMYEKTDDLFKNIGYFKYWDLFKNSGSTVFKIKSSFTINSRNNRRYNGGGGVL